MPPPPKKIVAIQEIGEGWGVCSSREILTFNLKHFWPKNISAPPGRPARGAFSEKIVRIVGGGHIGPPSLKIPVTGTCSCEKCF